MPMTIDKEVKRREELEFAGKTDIQIRRVTKVEVTPARDDEDYKNYPENYYTFLKIETADGDIVEIFMTAESEHALHLQMPKET